MQLLVKFQNMEVSHFKYSVRVVRQLGMLSGNFLLFTSGLYGMKASVLGNLKVLNSKTILGTPRQLLCLPLVEPVNVNVNVVGKEICRGIFLEIDIFSGMNHLIIWLLTVHKMTETVLPPHKCKGLENKTVSINTYLSG